MRCLLCIDSDTLAFVRQQNKCVMMLLIVNWTLKWHQGSTHRDSKGVQQHELVKLKNASNVSTIAGRWQTVDAYSYIYSSPSGNVSSVVFLCYCKRSENRIKEHLICIPPILYVKQRTCLFEYVWVNMARRKGQGGLFWVALWIILIMCLMVRKIKLEADLSMGNITEVLRIARLDCIDHHRLCWWY